MNAILKRFSFVALIMGLFSGLGIAVPAFADGGSNITVEISSVAAPATVNISSAVRLKSGGADVVSWMNPTHAGTISASQVKKARYVHVTTKMTSAQLYKKSHHAQYVRGWGDWTNNGRYGNDIAGFTSHAPKPGVIFVWNANLQKYEHGYSLLRGYKGLKSGQVVKIGNIKAVFQGYVKIHGRKYAIFMWCFNDFNGPHTVWLHNVVQANTEGEVLYQSNGSASDHSDASAHIVGSCPDGTQVDITLHTTADASTSLFVQYLLANQSGTLNNFGKQLAASVEAQVSGQGQAKASAAADAQVKLLCGGNPPPVVTHFTNVSCTGFEEITEGGSFLVDCDVSNDNGAPIAFSAKSNDGNTRVSGINCYSQQGKPSCTGNGTYEFRVSGVKAGMSSITATATSNGVSSSFTSDPFPVDLSGGGF